MATPDYSYRIISGHMLSEHDHAYVGAEPKAKAKARCTCGYEAASSGDLEEHIVSMARFDPSPHAEA